MIKIKNKNKFITFLCACLLVVGSLFGLVSAVGDTLAYTPSLIDNTTMTDYIVNYKNYDYNNIFDGYFKFNNYSTLTSGLGILFYDFNNSILSLNSGGKITVTSNNFRGYALGDSGTIYQITPNLSNYQIAYISTLFASSTTNLLDFVNKDVKCLSFLLNDGNIYNFISVSQFQIYNAYRQGLADADTTSAYNNGYNTGYTEGQTNGYNSGYSEGQTNGITQGQNNVINNPNNFDLYTQQQYQQNYINGQNSVINNPNAFGLYTQQQYQQNYTDGYNAGIIQGQNNVVENPNNFGLNTNQQLQDSYNQGFADGEQSSDAYQNGLADGIIQGQNDVINNPNNYNLYTETQYLQNYTDGYNKGLSVARYGIFGDITYNVTSGYLQANHTFDNPFVYYSSGLIYSSEVLDYYGSTTYSDILRTTIYFNQPFVFNDNIGFFKPSVVNASIEYTLTDINNIDYIYTYSITSSLDSDGVRVTTITNLPKEVDGSYLTGAVPTGTFINKLSFTYGPPISSLHVLDLYIHDLSSDYGKGYDIGFEDGVERGQSLVNTQYYYDKGYNSGEVDGFNSGYAQGLANSNNATFASMISAVIDVPINAFRNLFNFEILGFDMFSFFTGLFTLIVIIFVIRIVVGLIK